VTPTIDDAMAIVLAALSLLGLGIFGPGIANGIVSGGPQLGAGAAVGTGLPRRHGRLPRGAVAGHVAAGGAAALSGPACAVRGGAARRGRRASPMPSARPASPARPVSLPARRRCPRGRLRRRLAPDVAPLRKAAESMKSSFSRWQSRGAARRHRRHFLQGTIGGASVAAHAAPAAAAATGPARLGAAMHRQPGDSTASPCRRPCRPLRRQPRRRLFRQPFRKRPTPCSNDPPTRYGKSPEPETPYQRAAQVWDERIGSARVQAKNWR
jgi:type IV secretion system protein TrbL